MAFVLLGILLVVVVIVAVVVPQRTGAARDRIEAGLAPLDVTLVGSAKETVNTLRTIDGAQPGWLCRLV